ncbi:MAG: hypothetical protein KJO31_11270 [Gammaproteobacteria bacterium]|nr:hypothetical protein [Gammaproteobacteria bacterium]
MEKRYIDTHLLVDRYLQDSLGESELAEFEERLVWDEELVDEVQLASILRDGLRRTANSGDFSLRESRMNRVAEFFRVPQYAAAASFLFAVALGVGLLNSPMLSDTDRGGSTELKTDIVPLMALRSSDGPTIYVNADSWTVLLVDVVGSYDSFRATIRQRENGGEEIWSGDNLIPNYLDTISIGMPGRLLPAGQYLLTLEGTTAPGSGYEQIQDLPFTAAPAE